jgi:phosphate starvation-inducible protein PhoH
LPAGWQQEDTERNEKVLTSKDAHHDKAPVKKAESRAKRKEQKLEKQTQNIYKPVDIELRTESQAKAWAAVQDNLLTFLLGSAGSGKTFLAMAYAINAILSKQYEKIVLTRPIVESGEKLGFLPGTFGDKVNPYMQPLYDTMEVSGRPQRSAAGSYQ